MRRNVINIFSLVGIALILIFNLKVFAIQPIEDHSADKNALEALLPQNNELAAWERVSQPQFFMSENLWEYMNGQAESYLQYGFRMLAVLDYILEDNPNTLNIEIFKMESPKHAFGIYAAERSTEDKAIKIGIDGYIGPNVLNFWKGPYYVKLTTFESEKDLEKILFEFGNVIADKIEGNYSAPELFTYFPEENKFPMSERYIPKDFMGYSFLKNVYRVDYEREGNCYQVFLIENDSVKDALDSFNQYHQVVASDNKAVSIEKKSDYQLMKAGEEKIIFRYKLMLGGILNIDDQSKGEKIIEAIIKGLKNRDYLPK